MEASRRSRIRNFQARTRYFFVKWRLRIIRHSRISKRTWRWMAFGSLLSLLFMAVVYIVFMAGRIPVFWLIMGALTLVAMSLGTGSLIFLGITLVRKIPKKVHWLFYASLPFVFLFFFSPFPGMLLELFYLVFSFVFISGALAIVLSRKWNTFHRVRKLSGIFFLTLGSVNLVILIYFIAYPGPEVHPPDNPSMECTLVPPLLQADDPSLPGSYEWTTFAYGSGVDKRREIFGKACDEVSWSVDGSRFVDGWEKLSGKLRSAYWGFGADSLPLNGRVWMPEGEGPFPVALIVHGNHLDRDFSDDGYGYLGEHLASHGILTISVDENFLNGAMTNMRNGVHAENDARGWMLLKHLEFLRNRGVDSSSLFYGKADLHNVILIGHSRGGEAVNVAACFNELPYYPDDAAEKFSFHFGIRGVVAIAQVDGQYRPADRPTPVENINYLLLQGSLDADLTSYSGLRQLNRVTFTDTVLHFASGLYISGANHGQFNRSWGQYDISYPNGLLLNRNALMPVADQEKIARIYITAFARESLQPGSYLPLFMDYRTGREWLPEGLYLNQFRHSRAQIVAGYEEDIDLTTATDSSLYVVFDELASVYEHRHKLNYSHGGSQAVYLGWNNDSDSVPGFYAFRVKEQEGMDISDAWCLAFDVTVTGDEPGERMHAEPDEGEETDAEEAHDDDEENGDPIDFTVQLTDVEGEKAQVYFSDYYGLLKLPERTMFKLEMLAETPRPDAVPQHARLPVEDFLKSNPQLETERIQEIRFIFNGRENGVIALDNLQLSTF